MRNEETTCRRQRCARKWAGCGAAELNPATWPNTIAFRHPTGLSLRFNTISGLRSGASEGFWPGRLPVVA
jgi:hypothetical protein